MTQKLLMSIPKEKKKVCVCVCGGGGREKEEAEKIDLDTRMFSVKWSMWHAIVYSRRDMTPSYQFVLPEAVIRRYLYTVGVDPAPPPEREGLDKETLPGQIVKYWWGRNKEIGVVCLECATELFSKENKRQSFQY